MSTVNYHVVTALVMHYAAHRGDSGELGRPWERVLESSDFNQKFFFSHHALVDNVKYICVYTDYRLQLFFTMHSVHYTDHASAACMRACGGSLCH